MKRSSTDSFGIVPAEAVGPYEPRWWIKIGEKISLKWFARKRVLYHNSILHIPRAEHDRAVVARRLSKRTTAEKTALRASSNGRQKRSRDSDG